MIIEEASYIARIENEIQCIPDDLPSSSLSPSAKILASITPGPLFEYCRIFPVDSEETWLVVRTLFREEGTRGHVLSVGDVLKLGRVRFKVKEMRAFDEVYTDTTDLSDVSLDDIPEERDLKQCKFCLCEYSDRENPLISPCDCAGTMKHVHIECLQKWVSSRLVTRQSENSVTYHWKAMDCELCKHTYPRAIVTHGKRVELFTVEKPAGPYIILEVISKDRNSAGIQVISLSSNGCITMGRGHESDVRISDISVSRCHAKIYLRNGEFILEDNESKFGTLIQVKESLEISPSQQHTVQIGRSVITIAIKKQEALASSSLPANHFSKNSKEVEIKHFFKHFLD